MKWLKENGADVNAKDSKGKTPLQHTEEFDRRNAARWLKENGAK